MLRTVAIAFALAFAPSCRSTWHSARFVPAPLEIALVAPGEPRAEARALLAVRGVRRAQPAQERPAEVEMQLRLENVGDTPLALDPDGFDLVSADLLSFRDPIVAPAANLELAPGAQQLWLLRFAMPDGRDVDDLDWSGLNLRFRVRFGERAVVTGVTFERLVPPAYYGYDPYWGPYPYYPYRSHFRVGVGVVGG